MPQNRAPHFARHSIYTIQTHDDGFRCQQVLSLSPECWTKMITEEIAKAAFTVCLLSAVSLHQCHNEHRFHITLCRAHCLWARGARMRPFI